MSLFGKSSTRKKKTQTVSYVPAKEFERGKPPGLRYFLLFKEYKRLSDLAIKYSNARLNRAADSYYDESERLVRRWIERNNKGHDYEREGKISLAIKQYEKNVEDMCYLPASYQRLRVIYTKRKHFDEALRVCRAYLKFLDAIGDMGLHSSLDKAALRKQFEGWCTKLESKLEKEKSPN